MALDQAPPELVRRIEALRRKPSGRGLKVQGQVFPGDRAPVLANNRAGRAALFAMEWGYRLEGSKRVINARWETAQDKPLFRDGMRQRRCLIPASCYFEWEKAQGRRVQYAIGPREGGMLYLAGVYRLERRGEALVPAFAVLTRQAAPQLAFIHPRMPVILSPQGARAWLDIRRPAAQVLEGARLDMDCRPVQDRTGC